MLYLALEDARMDFENRLGLFLDGKDSPSNLFYLTGEDFNFNTPTLDYGKGQLISFLEESLRIHPDIQVVLIDVFGIIRSKRQRNEDFTQHERRDLLSIIRFVSKHHLAVVIAHHVSKTQKRLGNGKIEAIGSGAGSYVVSGTVHAEMVISPKGEHGERIFSCEGRRIPSQRFVLIDDFPRWKCAGTAEEFEAVNDPIVQAVRVLCAKNGGKWRGTAKQIQDANPKITSCVSKKTFDNKMYQRLQNAGFQYRSIKNGSGVLHEFTSMNS